MSCAAAAAPPGVRRVRGDRPGRGAVVEDRRQQRPCLRRRAGRQYLRARMICQGAGGFEGGQWSVAERRVDVRSDVVRVVLLGGRGEILPRGPAGDPLPQGLVTLAGVVPPLRALPSASWSMPQSRFPALSRTPADCARRPGSCTSRATAEDRYRASLHKPCVLRSSISRGPGRHGVVMIVM